MSESVTPELPQPDPQTNLPSETCQSLSACIQALGMPYIQRHLFLCADQTKPKCCDQALSLKSWNYLKQRLQELGLDRPSPPSPSNDQAPTCMFRTKANCLRVCQQGPILVIYPEGVWYHSTTPEVLEQIIQTHLLQNQILQDYAFLVHPLSNSPDSNTSNFT